MNLPEKVNEDLIVCAGGAESGGPCKVNHKLTVNIFPYNLYLSRVTVGGHSQQKMRTVPMFLLELSAKGLERVAASRTTLSSPASLLSCHG